MTRGRSLLVVLGLLGLLLAVKLALILSLSDVFFYGEELEKGTAAKAMLDGLRVPHSALAYHYYEGGGFVVSHLTALAFLLVGPNLWAHKLVSLAFNLAIALTGIRFLTRNWGRAAGVVFGVLIVFAPLPFQKLSLLNLGIHWESSLFLLLVCHLGTRLLCDEVPARATLVLFGLAAGFGTYFNFGILPLAAYWIGLLLLLRRESVTRGRELALAWSLLLGALPLLLMWWAVGREVFDIHGTPLFGGGEEAEGPAGGIAAVGEFFAGLWRDSTALDLGMLALWIAVAGLGTAVVARLRGGRALRAYLALGGYPLVFAVLYVLSPFAIGDPYHYFLYQRLTPFWILGTCLCAATIGTLVSRVPLPGGGGGSRVPRAAGWVLFALFTVHGAAGTLRAIRAGTGRGLAENAALLADTRGFTYVEYFEKFLRHLTGDPAAKLRTLLSFHEPHRALLYADAAAALFRKSELPPEEVLAILREVDPDHTREFMPGLGPYLLHRANGRMKLALQGAVAMPSRLRAVFVEALGRRGVYLNPPPERLRNEIAELAENPPPAPYYRGVGHRVFRAFRLDPDGAEEFMGALPEPQQGLVREGYERARRLYAFGPTQGTRDP